MDDKFGTGLQPADKKLPLTECPDCEQTDDGLILCRKHSEAAYKAKKVIG